MNFFDYLFCRLYWWNTQIIKEKDIPVGYSVIGLSVFQTYSIAPIYELLYVLKICTGDLSILNMNPFLLINAIILIVNYFYLKYEKDRYKVLLKKISKMTKNDKTKLDIFCITYILDIISN
jgi:hypothetical protein